MSSKNRAQQFTKVFSGVIIVSLFVFFVILIPYVNVLSQSYDIRKDLTMNEASHSAYLQIGDDLKQLRLGVATLPEQITNMSKSFHNITLSYMVSTLYCSGMLHNITEWKECLLIAMIEDRRFNAQNRVESIEAAFAALNSSDKYLEKYHRIVNDSDSVPQEELVHYPQLRVLSFILDSGSLAQGMNQLSNLTVAINQTYNNSKVISNQSNLWNSSNLTENEIERLMNESSFFLNNNQGLFSFQWDDEYMGGESDFVEPIIPLTKIVSNLQGNLTEKRNELQNIESRLEGFESPFGIIPLGFREIIFVFPFGLAIGSYICFNLLHEADKFRHIAFCSQRNCTKGESDYLKYALTSPIWYDNTKDTKQQWFKVFLLSIPGAIFASSLILVLYGWFTLPSLYGDLSNLQEIEPTPIPYFLLYILGSAIMGQCYGQFFVYLRQNPPRK